MGEPTPEFCIPYFGKYLWDIYIGLNNAINRTRDGIYTLIPPTEYQAWLKLTGTLVYPREYDILSAMDRVYCEEANKELEDIQSRRDEERKREVEAAQKKPRRGK